jgi:hypothetical protein
LDGFSFSFHSKKILDFGSSFCRIELNIMQNFWQNGIHSPFWILALRSQKKKLKSQKKNLPIP